MVRTIALAGFVVFQIAAQAPPGGSISGRVTNRVTGAGIGGVTVSVCLPTSPAPICELGPHTIQQAVTDDGGAFRIGPIPDGQYTNQPTMKEGFFPKILGTPIHVFGDTRLDIQLTPLASVRGRVLDSEGKPVAGISVKGPRNRPAVTDENGEYALEELPPGRAFTLSATPKSQAETKDGERLVTTYYPSVVDSDQAMPIMAEGDLAGYDIRLRSDAARRIRGVVIDVDGKPAAHAKVSIVKPNQGMIMRVRGAGYNFGDRARAVSAAEPVETKEDGSFAFPPVLEGDWSVQAVLRSEEDYSARSGAVEIRVSKTDMDDLEIRLAKPFDIEVRADWGDSPPATLPTGLAGILSLDRAEGSLADVAQPGHPQVFKGFAGRFFIGPGGLTPGYYVAAAMLDNRDVLGQVVQLAGPASLKMIYKTDGGSVRGTVEHGADMIVVLMSDATPAALLGLSVRCDADGGFVIRDVPPGDYTALAFQDLGPIGSPVLQRMLAASGRRVKVEAGAASQVDLRVARQP